MAKIKPYMLRWYPELQLVKQDLARRELLKRANRKAYLTFWGVHAWLFAMVVSLILHWTITENYLHPVGAAFTTILVVPFIAVPLTYRWARSGIRRSLRNELRSMGHSICVPCGYDTRGLTEERCPECGKEFEPVEPKP